MHTQETIKVVPARYPLRAVGAVLALLVLAVVIQSVAFNPRWEWGAERPCDERPAGRRQSVGRRTRWLCRFRR